MRKLKTANDVISSLKIQITAMSRGFIVLDENVAYLESPLTERNFRVFVVPSGTADRVIVKSYLGGRRFITKNSKDFKSFVPEMDIGLINADTVTKDPEILADMISAAWLKFKLGSIRGGFILNLNSFGRHKFEEFE